MYRLMASGHPFLPKPASSKVRGGFRLSREQDEDLGFGSNIRLHWNGVRSTYPSSGVDQPLSISNHLVYFQFCFLCQASRPGDHEKSRTIESTNHNVLLQCYDGHFQLYRSVQGDLSLQLLSGVARFRLSRSYGYVRGGGPFDPLGLPLLAHQTLRLFRYTILCSKKKVQSNYTTPCVSSYSGARVWIPTDAN